jgi:integrase
VAEDWFKRVVVKDKHRTSDEIRRCLERYVYPKWATREFVSVRRKDIADLTDALDDSSGIRQSNVVFQIISRICGWYSLRDETYVNPIIKGMRRSEDKPRERVLFDDTDKERPPDFTELRAVWKAAEANGTFGAFVRLALLTAQRRSVLLNLRWDSLNGDVWSIPQTDDREKANAGALKLPKQAMAIIERLPRFKGNPYVFAGRGDKPIAGISGLKAKLDKASGVSDWTIHDLRRTARSLLSRVTDRDTAERCLGHSVARRTEKTYDVHEYYEEKAHALRALARLIETIINGEPSGKVVRLKTRKSG